MKKFLTMTIYTIFFSGAILGLGYLYCKFLEWFDNIFGFGASLILIIGVAVICISCALAKALYEFKHREVE